MAKSPQADTQDPHDADEALKKRLLSRIAVAGVLVVALLGGLAAFDAFYGSPQHKTAPSEAPGEKVAEAEAQKAKPEEKAAEAPAEKPPEAAPAEQLEATKPAVPAEAERTTGAVTPPPKPARPLTAPATARPATIKPSAPVAAPQKPAAEIAKTAPPPSPIAQHAPASRPLTQAAESRRQYVIQMGVFNNIANAEDLRAKLEHAGVPSQIEARVQVGPFATRQEADAAREKLRALGMDTGILTAIKR